MNRLRTLLTGTIVLTGTASGQNSIANLELDQRERLRVVQTVADDIKTRYVDRRTGLKMAASLSAHAQRGDDAAATDGPSLVRLLNNQLQAIQPDPELEVIYRTAPFPTLSQPDPEEQRRYRQMLLDQHCMLDEVKLLGQGIGYMKLDGFGDRAVCAAMLRAAMSRLNNARAIIFDLRDNRGGMPETVELVAGYLFDHPEYWFNPREPTRRRSWTQSPVGGNRLADKPVYVLTSGRTISGGEQFCYNLKALKRATLVGETTAGQAHASAFYRIDDHFGVAIPTVRPINPYGAGDWQGTGVAPDVPVKSQDALAKALVLAQRPSSGRPTF
jgi:retinol-binding protein 3